MTRRQAEHRVIHRVVEKLRKAYHPTQVVLFGSYAHGRPTPESDVDLLIVKDTAKPFYRRLFEVRRLVSPILRGRPFDPIVVTPAELRRRLAGGDQFLHDIVTRGKPVYDGRR